MMEKQEKRRMTNRNRLVILLIGVFLILEFYIFRGDKEFMEQIIVHISGPIRKALSTIFSFFTFSAGEFVYMIGIPVIAAVLIVSTVRMLCGKIDRKRFAAVILTSAIVVTYAGAGFCWLWSVSYYGYDILDRTGMELRDITIDELEEVAYIFAENANALSDKVSRDANNDFAESEDEIFAASLHVYDNLEKEERWSFLDKNEFMPKRLIFSKLATGMGYSGFYFPLTAEANINMDSPAAFRPVIIAHEMAHQRLVASEAETNFVGILACVTSDNEVYEYSGYLMGLMYLARALQQTDYEKWEKLTATYTPQVVRDLEVNSEYWAKNKSLFNTISREVYSKFLKSNGQQKLNITYNACIYFLVMYYEDYVMDSELAES